MDGLYNETLHHLDKAFRKLQGMVPAPQRVPLGDGYVYRYVEKTIQQAVIQKLARVVSGLHAARLLLENGFLQEQGAIHRMLDEFHEDVLFLSYAIIGGEQIPEHDKFLQHFYQEDEKLYMVRRKKIQTYNAEFESKWTGESSDRGVKLSRTLYSSYSRFVHGVSSHIMDMYGGDPRRFHLHGMQGTSRQEEHRYDLYNPFFRAIIGFAVAAEAFGDRDLSLTLHTFLLDFDRQSGRNNAFRGSDSQSK
ncbi:MAG: hypothetical protein K0S58_582 [Nitrospira sp.]|jgi:hypothetical protein|nr:hypothetical protein [Nitrospira sp.]